MRNNVRKKKGRGKSQGSPPIIVIRGNRGEGGTKYTDFLPLEQGKIKLLPYFSIFLVTPLPPEYIPSPAPGVGTQQVEVILLRSRNFYTFPIIIIIINIHTIRSRERGRNRGVGEGGRLTTSFPLGLSHP